MKIKSYLFTQLIFLFYGVLSAQEPFPVTQLTTAPAQEGFASWMPGGKELIYSNTDIWDTMGNLGIWKLALMEAPPVQIYQGIAKHPQISPDGKWLAFAAIEGEILNLFVMPFQGGRAIRLTSVPRFNENPRCSPEGKKIAFTSTRSGNFDIWLIDVDVEKLTRMMDEP
jgi:Tol biopolymer transport system component